MLDVSFLLAVVKYRQSQSCTCIRVIDLTISAMPVVSMTFYSIEIRRTICIATIQSATGGKRIIEGSARGDRRFHLQFF